MAALKRYCRLDPLRFRSDLVPSMRRIAGATGYKLACVVFDHEADSLVPKARDIEVVLTAVGGLDCA